MQRKSLTLKFKVKVNFAVFLSKVAESKFFLSKLRETFAELSIM